MNTPIEYYIGQFAAYKPGKLVTHGAPRHCDQSCAEKQTRAVANQSIKKSME